MFRAVKAHLALEISLKNGTVHIKPVAACQQKGIVPRTLARCEAFLAQVFLQEQASAVNLSHLVLYFKRRGWQVQ